MNGNKCSLNAVNKKIIKNRASGRKRVSFEQGYSIFNNVYYLSAGCSGLFFNRHCILIPRACNWVRECALRSI